MTTRLEEIKNYLAFHNKPSRLADQPLVQDLAWAVARIEKLEAALTFIASKTTFVENYSRTKANPFGNEIENPFCEFAKEALAEVEKG